MFINNQAESAQNILTVRKTMALGEVPVSRKRYWAVGSYGRDQKTSKITFLGELEMAHIIMFV